MAKAPGEAGGMTAGLQFANLVPVDTDEYYAAQHGGFRCIGAEIITIPAMSFDQLFPSLPSGVCAIELTIRTSDLMLTFDDTEPTLNIGNYYKKSKTYRLALSTANASRVLAYATGIGDAEIYYTLWSK